MSSKQYSDEDIISEIQRVSEEYCNGETPTVKEFRKFGEISDSAVRGRFGCWNEGIRKAELNENIKTDISKEDIAESIIEISQRFCDGKAPTYSEYQNLSNHSSNTVAQEFGSWNQALEYLGMERNIPMDTPLDVLSEDIIRVFENYSEGEYPTLGDMRKHGEYSAPTYRKRFGSWTDALIYSGFPNPYPSEWPLSGEEHPSWEGGYEQYYGESWYKQRLKTLERDNYSCSLCGRGEEEIGRTPPVHHIKPKKYWDVEEEHQEMNSLDNLVTLCYSHHGKLEGRFQDCSFDEFVERAGEIYV